MDIELCKVANKIRIETFSAIHHAGGGHYGGCMSVIDILTVLYFRIMQIDPSKPDWADRDRLILSKGHAGPALYTTLSNRGFFDTEVLKELDKNGGRLAKHTDRKVPGVDYSTGALGMGLSVANGLAAAAKLDGKNYHIYTILGDGELNEGQIWEAIMTAAQYRLDNLIAIIDRNLCQIDGPTEQIKPLEPLAEKLKNFGWNVIESDGHNLTELENSFREALSVTGKPCVIIAKTIKGKGIPFMESTLQNQVDWHAGTTTVQQFNEAMTNFEGCE